MMKIYSVNSKNLPTFTVIANTMTGAVAKAESISVKLYGAKAANATEFTVRFKSNAR
jgi:hypothetical protein